jgi:predicted TIM-barrel fold metal-dependent hydrolase
MIIDIDMHPYLLEDVCVSEEDERFAIETTGLCKSSVISMKECFNQLTCARIDRAVMSPIDLVTTAGRQFVTNEQTHTLAKTYPDRFIGFASVDPHREDVADTIEEAFSDFGLKGLYLHPSLQRFYPDDPCMEHIYAICLAYDRPILFDMGASMYPGLLSEYAHPLRLEGTAVRHPNLRICISRFGWPWVRETSMLMLKCRNIYTDTAIIYFGTAVSMYTHIFTADMPLEWVEKQFRHQVMFGSGEPGLEQLRMIEAIRNLDLRQSTIELILGDNAENFIGGETSRYDR